MARQILVLVGLVFIAAGCSRDTATPTPTTSTSARDGPVTTTVGAATSTITVLEPLDPPRLGSTLEMFPLPIRVIEDSILHVDGSCVTAQEGDTATLLVFNLPHEPPTGGARKVWVQGAEVHFEDLDPATPTLVLSSGARYQFRGIPFDAVDGDLAEPMPSTCLYDEQLVLLGALDVPVGHGLTTRPVEVMEAVASIGINSTTITIDGACTTVSSGERELLVVWPAATVSLLDDHTIHMSRWEALFAEAVVTSGDTVTLAGAVSDRPPGNPVDDCEYDGTFFAELVRPLSG